MMLRFTVLGCLMLSLCMACAQAPKSSVSDAEVSAAPDPLTATDAEPSVPVAPDRRCAVDSDCAVKNVGNCCGYYPACLHKDAVTDPQAVLRRCERDGLASTCGHPDINACRCVNQQCEPDAQAAENAP